MISALSRRRRLTVLGLGLALLGSAVSIAPSAQAAVWRPFADNSPFNTRIAAGPALDPNSSAMVDRATRTSALHANLVAYGVPIASASSSSPTYQVTCTMGWGTCPFSGRSMPIPTGVTPSPGSDGAPPTRPAFASRAHPCGSCR